MGTWDVLFGTCRGLPKGNPYYATRARLPPGNLERARRILRIAILEFTSEHNGAPPLNRKIKIETKKETDARFMLQL